MSNIYDNWERLVAAVLKREEIWELCHAPYSRTTSISSVSSDFSSSSSFRLDENLKSEKSEIQESDNQIESEWIEQYETGVYIYLAAFKDERFEIKRVRFSRRKFTEKEAETWWANNREKVYKKYSICSEELISRNKKAQTQKNVFEKNVKPKHSEVGGSGAQIVGEWTVTYEPGVYVTLLALGNGSNDLKRVRFSRRRFSEDVAEAWWLKNGEKVCEKYNVQGLPARIARIGYS